jgi:hypothetical protein
LIEISIGNRRGGAAFLLRNDVFGRGNMRSILLWLVGVPIPIILLLALCTHHF